MPGAAFFWGEEDFEQVTLCLECVIPAFALQLACQPAGSPCKPVVAQPSDHASLGKKQLDAAVSTFKHLQCLQDCVLSEKLFRDDLKKLRKANPNVSPANSCNC